MTGVLCCAVSNDLPFSQPTIIFFRLLLETNYNCGVARDRDSQFHDVLIFSHLKLAILYVSHTFLKTDFYLSDTA